MEKTLKNFKTILLILVFVVTISLNINVYADYSISDVFEDAQDFVSSGDSPEDMIDTQALKDTSSFIYKLLYSIGMVVAVVVGMVLGIQFMVASVEDKAKIKEALIAYVVGCLVLFGAFGIWKLVVEIVQSTTTI